MATKITKKSTNSRAISDLLPKRWRSRLRKDYFPKISRFITERKKLLWLSSLLVLGFGIVLSFTLLHTAMGQYKAAIAKKQRIEKQLAYWQGIIRKYADYRDGYVMIAGLEYQLGNTDQSLTAIEQAQKLDPNNQTLQTMEKSIQE